MRLKVSNKDGTHIVAFEDSSVSLGDLIEAIKLKISPETPDSTTITSIKNGFPPRPIDLSNLEAPIDSLGIANGGKILVENDSNGASGCGPSRTSTKVNNAAPATKGLSTDNSSDIPAVQVLQSEEHLILRNVPDDNSCLFNAISYAVDGLTGFETESTKTPHTLRAVVASYIKSDPFTYNEAILGKEPEAYCDWIEKKDSWGGAIELGILADYFNVRINCVDVESGNILRFQNEAKDPSSFIILVYSGVHYDLLCANSVVSTARSDKLKDSSSWPPDSEYADALLDASKRLCKLLQSKDYSTNTTTFRVRCLECYGVFVGEMGANKHASETNHVRFGEVKD